MKYESIEGIKWKDVVHCPTCNTALIVRKCACCREVFILDPMKPSYNQLSQNHIMDYSDNSQGKIRHLTQAEEEDAYYEMKENV